MIKLEVRTDGGYHSFTASFSTEDQALAYVARKGSVASFSEIESTPIPEENTKLIAMMYPTCHHGMSESLCMDPYGPHHFGTREWEMSQYPGM